MNSRTIGVGHDEGINQQINLNNQTFGIPDLTTAFSPLFYDEKVVNFLTTCQNPIQYHPASSIWESWLLFFTIIFYAPLIEEAGKLFVGHKFTFLLAFSECFQTYVESNCMLEPAKSRRRALRLVVAIIHFLTPRLPKFWHSCLAHSLLNFALAAGTTFGIYYWGHSHIFSYDRECMQTPTMLPPWIPILGQLVELTAYYGLGKWFCKVLDIVTPIWNATPAGPQFLDRFGQNLQRHTAAARRETITSYWRPIRARLEERWQAEAQEHLRFIGNTDGYTHVHPSNCADLVDLLLSFDHIIGPYPARDVGYAIFPDLGRRMVIRASLFSWILINQQMNHAKANDDTFFDFAQYVERRDDGHFMKDGLSPQTTERMMLAIWNIAHAQTTVQVLCGAVQIYHSFYPGKALSAEILLALGSVSNFSAAGPDGPAILAETVSRVFKLLFLRPYLAADFLPLHPYVHRLFKSLGSACKDSPALAEEVANLLEMVFHKLPVSLATGDWSTWHHHDALVEIEQRFAAIRVLRGESYDDNFQRVVDLADFRYELHEIELKVKEIADDSSRTVAMRSEARRILVQVTTERAMFRKQFGDSFSRVRPFAIHLVGLPGAGKSNVLEQIARNCLVANKESMPEKLSYTISDGQKYFDAYSGAEPLVIVNDPAIGLQYSENPLNFFIQLLTNESFSPNNARAELKEATRATPHMVTLSTNELRLADRFIKTPSAFYRRWHYVIHVHAKPEFTENGFWLDEKKCLEDSSGDFYRLSICKWIPDSAQPLGVNCVEIMESVDIFEAIRFLNKQYVAHMARQAIIVARLNDRSTDLCSHCGILWSIHPSGCKHGGTKVPSGVVALTSDPNGPLTQFSRPSFLKREVVPPPEAATTEFTYLSDGALRASEHGLVNPAFTAANKPLYLLATITFLSTSWWVVFLLLIPFVIATAGVVYGLFVVVDIVAPGADKFSRAKAAVEVVSATRMVVREGYRRLTGDASSVVAPMWNKALSRGLTFRERLKAIRAADLVSIAAPRAAVLGVGIIIAAVTAWRIRRQFAETVVPETFKAAGTTLSIPRPLTQEGCLPVVELAPSVRCTPAEKIEIATIQARATMTYNGSDTYGMLIGGKFFLTYAHNKAVRDAMNGYQISIKITTGAGVATFAEHSVLPSDVVRDETIDLAIILCRGLTPVRKYRYFSDGFPPDGSKTMAHVLVGDEATKRPAVAAEYFHSYSRHEFGRFGPYYETPDPIKNGHCGSLLLGERNEVLGMAVAINNTTGRSVFVHINNGVIGRLIAGLGVKRGAEMYAAEPLEEIMELYPEVSMTALSSRASIRRIPISYNKLNARVWGTLLPFHASADKSKMRVTAFYERVLERQPWIENRWKLPHGGVCDTPKGRMDAYSKMIANTATQDDSHIDVEVMERALLDFSDTLVQGVCEPYVEAHGPVRPLTIEEATRGTEDIRALPGSTSSGMPKGGSKREYYIPDPQDQDPDYYRLDDEAMTLYHRYMKTLNDGLVPCVPAKVFLKLNEVRPAEKVDAAGTRTINALPFVYNLIIKRYFGPIFSVLQGNIEHWESCIGVNMGSHDAARLVAHLLRVPVGKKITRETIRQLKARSEALGAVLRDVDAKHFDDSFTALKLDLIRRLLQDVASALGYSEGDVTIVGLVVESLAAMCYVVRGDVIQLLKNSSGHGMTAEVNSVMTSLIYRYVFYAAKRDGLLPPDACFSDFMRVLTYGDDGASSSVGAALGIPFEAVKKYGLEFGFELTPGDKAATTKEWKTLDEITFLKRHLIIDEEIGIVRAPLEEESIWRMLTWRRPSAIGDVHYHSALLGNAQREWWMYGRERFDAETAWLASLADERGLTNYVPWKSYDELLCDYDQGKFTTWDL